MSGDKDGTEEMERSNSHEMTLASRGEAERAMAPRAQQDGVSSAIEHSDGSRELRYGGDVSQSAVATRINADMQSRVMQAQARPRSWLKVQQALMNECKRPGFAKVAKYSKPVGGKQIIGPSIRFAEAAMRTMTNIFVRESVIHDDPRKRIIGVLVVDLESNVPLEQDITIEKTIERKTLKQGQVALSQRVNSGGEVTFLVTATEDEIATKKNAQVSKVLRNAVLRLLPGDILEDCMEAVEDTKRGEAEKDPASAKKDAVEAFSKMSVTLDHLAEYLGHTMDSVTPAELAELRTVYATIKDGESNWADILAAKTGKASPAEGGGAATASPAKGDKGMAARKGKADPKVEEPKKEEPAKPEAKAEPKKAEREPGGEG